MKSRFLFISSIALLTACGGADETATSNEATEEAEIAVTRPAPKTTNSGNSFELVKETGSAEYNTGNGYTLLYTLLDYTTNVDFSNLPIEEFNGPNDDQQLVKLRVEVIAKKFRDLNCKEPLDGFHLLFGSEDIQAFTRFSEEFKAEMEPKCLALDESQIFDVYFKIPLNTDLTAAQLSLYRGSSEEPMVLNLNP